MGGLGSGPYGLRGSKVRKKTVEETLYLNIQSLKPHLNKKAVTCSWNDGEQTISILNHEPYILLAYSVSGEKIMSKVMIETTKVGYGERLWFRCPFCDKRTARLYFVGKLFKCRDCHDLTYLSCQESGNPLDYLAMKIKRQQRKLGLDGKDIHELPTFKPKNMHWETFERERERLELMILKREQEWLKACHF